MLYPISFSFPEELIVPYVPFKTSHTATHQYQFNDSKPYLEMYRKSIFGHTSLKCGWDCLRHYEILSQGTIPFFHELKRCPTYTLTTFPKEQVLGLMDKYFTLSYDQIMSTSSSILYDDLNSLLDYTRNHLTTKQSAKYILSKTEYPETKKILFLTNGLQAGDYLEAMTMHGLFHITEGNVDLYPNYDSLYDNFPIEETKKLYGKGFNYTRLLPSFLKRTPSEDEIWQKIKERYYEHIILYMHCRSTDLMPFIFGDRSINMYYNINEVSVLCGKDCDDYTDAMGSHILMFHHCMLKVLSNSQNVFIRELGD